MIYCVVPEALATAFLDVSRGGVRTILAQQVHAGEPVEVLLRGYTMCEPIRITGSVCHSAARRYQ